jgi:hypothetical protein
VKYHDDEEAARLNAEQWQLDLLKMNPEYLGWGPHEDYMGKEGDGWDSRQVFATWADFGPWKLDDLNECANFYFSVNRASEECATCAGKGTHPDAQWISESWYSHSSPFKPQGFRAMQAEAIMERFGGPARHLHGFGNYPSEELLQKYGAPFREFCEEMRTRRHHAGRGAGTGGRQAPHGFHAHFQARRGVEAEGPGRDPDRRRRERLGAWARAGSRLHQPVDRR